MTPSTILTMLIGLGLPLLVALVTKDVAPAWVKVGLLALLSAISGAVTSLAGTLPTTLTGWQHLALNILMTFAMAVAADIGAWKPAGTTPAITRKTSHFGLGRGNARPLAEAA